MELAEANNQVSIPIGEGGAITVGFLDKQVVMMMHPTPVEGASVLTAKVNSSFARLLARLLNSYADRLDDYHNAVQRMN